MKQHRRRGRLLAPVRTRAQAMAERAEDGVRRGTRRRSAVLLTAGLGALASMFWMVSHNVMAVNFTSASNVHQIYTDRIHGTDAAGYLKTQAKYDGDVATAQLGFNQAQLSGLCLITTESVGVLGDVSMVIIAGEKVDGTVAGTTSITANQLFIATDQITGQGDQIAKMTLGQSADTVEMGTYGPFSGGTPGGFGLQAQTMNVSDLDGRSFGIDLQGEINLPDLKIKVVPGVADKTACTAQY